MKLNVRPLKGEAFDIEVDPEETVQSMKQKIASAKPALPVEVQKAIHSGKILADASSIRDAGIKDGDFVVLMVNKAKSQDAAAPPAAAGAAAAAAAVLASESSAVPAAVAGAPAAPAAAEAPAPTAADTEQAAAANLVRDGAFQTTVAQLCEMGFARPDVERCLRAAFNNPDRAIEYLMSGIPEHVTRSQAAEAAGAGRGTAQPPPAAAPLPGALVAAPSFPQVPSMAGGPAAATNPTTGPLAALKNHPRFNELRRVVHMDPSQLNRVLGVLMQSNPELIKLIAENQAEFVQMLEEPAAALGPGTQDPVAAMLASMQQLQAQQGGGQPHGAGRGTPQQASGPPQQPQQPALPQVPQGAPPPAIQLSAQEREAVARLTQLGFGNQQATEAFLACERNEELAANYLFDAMEQG